MNSYNKLFGKEYASQHGYIARVNPDRSFNHRFGGDSWRVTGIEGEESPALLMVLDLKDPKLSGLNSVQCSEIPLFSYINSDHWGGRQIYSIDCDKRKVRFTYRRNSTGFALSGEDRFSLPLLESKMELVEMTKDDYPFDEDHYWRCLDDFLGGSKIIRVLGMPLWRQGYKEVRCHCGGDTTHVASIGYENWDGPYELLKTKPYFIGEGALYFFFCSECKSVIVESGE